MSDLMDLFTINNIVALILGIIGLVWLINGIRQYQKITQVNNWPKTNATVQNAVLVNSANQAIDPRNVPANAIDKYTPQVTYAYRVNNTNYQSDKIFYNTPKNFDATQARTLFGQIYPGSVVQIRYNPQNPSEAYIYPGSADIWPIIIGLLLLLLALYLGFYHGKSQQRGLYKDVFNKPLFEPTPNLTDMETPTYRVIRNANIF